ncbi:hypothetical protein AQ505_25405 [Pedobacter sp. PACM 27299]|uniref:hypothetical protein n=1 Tax=Pedobacter sp. PACM 27299 TaxID=1727164 RepID=UPI0007067D14|nr:hypothetical protein [Pedobacter sp. PACM 27299]ALL08514.1 hypothetical protein AQ505_25405 [Pedobacter sp. PACM 27299]
MRIKFLALTLLVLTATACKKEASTDLIEKELPVKADKVAATRLPSDSLKSSSVNARVAFQLPYKEEVPGRVILYKLIRYKTNQHFMASSQEAYQLINTINNDGFSEWQADGSVFYLYATSTPTQFSGPLIPLYRYYRPSNGDHYFTPSSATPSQYISEGIVGYLQSGKDNMALGSPIYSYFSLKGKFDRIYTFDFNWIGNGNSNWYLEGIIGYL